MNTLKQAHMDACALSARDRMNKIYVIFLKHQKCWIPAYESNVTIFQDSYYLAGKWITPSIASIASIQ